MRLAQHGFGFFAGNALGPQVNQHDVALCAATDNAQTALRESFCNDLGVFDDLLLVSFELGCEGFFERHSLGRNHMHKGAALQARKDGAVNGFFVLGFHQDDAAARAAQTLVGGGGDHVGVGHGVGVNACRNEAGIVRHVDQEQGAYIFGHFGKSGKVNVQTVSGSACNDELGL